MAELTRRTLLAVGALAGLGAARPHHPRRDWYGRDPWRPAAPWGRHS